MMPMYEVSLIQPVATPDVVRNELRNAAAEGRRPRRLRTYEDVQGIRIGLGGLGQVQMATASFSTAGAPTVQYGRPAPGSIAAGIAEQVTTAIAANPQSPTPSPVQTLPPTLSTPSILETPAAAGATSKLWLYGAAGLVVGFAVALTLRG